MQLTHAIKYSAVLLVFNRCSVNYHLKNLVEFIINIPGTDTPTTQAVISLFTSTRKIIKTFCTLANVLQYSNQTMVKRNSIFILSEMNYQTSIIMSLALMLREDAAIFCSG